MTAAAPTALVLHGGAGVIERADLSAEDERGIREVHVCGLARDYCVLWSAQDAAISGFAVRFLWDLTRPVSAANDAATRIALNECGIHIG